MPTTASMFNGAEELRTSSQNKSLRCCSTHTSRRRLTVGLLIALLPGQVVAHGRLTTPLNRIAQWREREASDPTVWDGKYPKVEDQLVCYDNSCGWRMNEPPVRLIDYPGPTTHIDHEYSTTGYRCHDFAAMSPRSTLVAGQEMDVAWTLDARHPGDCYIYISYDEDKTKPQNWIKLAAFPTCSSQEEFTLRPSPDKPPGPDGTTYSWKMMLPEWLPSCDHCVLRWEWHTVQNPDSIEFYTTCADVRIDGTSESHDDFLSKVSPVVQIDRIEHLALERTAYRYPNVYGPEYLVGPPIATYDGSVPSPSPSPPPAPSAPCPELQFTVDKTHLDGSIGYNWCFSVTKDSSGEYDEGLKSVCENTYLEPTTTVDNPATYAFGSCQGGCAECVYSQKSTGKWACLSAGQTFFGCPSSPTPSPPPSASPSPPPSASPSPPPSASPSPPPSASPSPPPSASPSPPPSASPSPPPSASPSPPPSPSSPASTRQLCSEMADTLTDVRELDPPEWCNSDPARRNPTDCPKFFAKLPDGRLKRCAYSLLEDGCYLQGPTCEEDRPSPPPSRAAPSPPPMMTCSEMVATLTDVRTLDPPQWCNTDPARRNAIECPKFYATLDDGGRKQCAYDAINSRCVLHLGQICTNSS